MFLTITVLLAATLPAAAAEMDRAWRYFCAYLRFFNIDRAAVSAYVVMSYTLLRCNPPMGVPLPECMSRRVLPRTAAGDIGLLRRRARLMKDAAFLAVLTDEDVLRLGTVLGANVKRAKTSKAPILLTHLETLWRDAAVRTAGFVRDVFLLTLGLIVGARRRELVALRLCDLEFSAARDDFVVRIIVRDKTNVTILDAQHPRVLCVAHALLSEVWAAFRPTFVDGRAPAQPLFPRMVGVTVTSQHLAPDTVNTIVRERLPGLPVSPHSLRVGFATELHAAGVPLQLILELGRWSSLAGLLYVLPSADSMTAATRSIGTGVVSFDRVLVQRSLGTHAQPPRASRLA